MHDHHHARANTNALPAYDLAGVIASMHPAPRTAIDLGCGHGNEAMFVASLGIDVIGVDMSDDVLAIARAEAETRGISVRWHLGSVLELPVEDSSIDLAFDRGCLHHLTPDEQRRYALEAARVLRPGGLLVLRDFNHPAHHSHALSPESIESMVAESGLTVHSILQFDAASTGHHQRALLATLVRAA